MQNNQVRGLEETDKKSKDTIWNGRLSLPAETYKRTILIWYQDTVQAAVAGKGKVSSDKDVTNTTETRVNKDGSASGQMLAWLQVLGSFCLYFNTYGSSHYQSRSITPHIVATSLWHGSSPLNSIRLQLFA